LGYGASGAGEGARAASPQMRTILLVDDSPVARRVLTQRLVAEGFEVCEAASLATARRMDLSQVACAIVDLELADGDGTDLARILVEKRPALPIAFFTMGTAPSLVEGARGRGAVFLKPDMNPLVAWAKRVLRPSQPPPTK
jgi:DNA-binding response OmpR family regulator